jgi:hypothetical protein
MAELFDHLLAGQVTEREWIVLSIATVIGLLAWRIGRRRWERRIEAWAESQGVVLYDYRRARFFEGPHRWTRGDTWTVFSIEVTDSTGMPRQGWLSFRARWFRQPAVEVIWR